MPIDVRLSSRYQLLDAAKCFVPDYTRDDVDIEEIATRIADEECPLPRRADDWNQAQFVSWQKQWNAEAGVLRQAERDDQGQH